MHRKPPRKKGPIVAVVLALVVILIGGAGGALYYYRIPLGLFAGSRLDVDRELGYVVQDKFAANYLPKEGDGFPARWWTEKYLVRAMPNALVGYDLAAGRTAYTVKLPDNHFCQASRQQSGQGYVAVLQGTRKEGCRRITVVDLANGKVVWSKEVAPAGPARSEPVLTDFPQYDHRPAILGDRLYVPTDKGGHILDLATGSVIQQPNPKAGCVSTQYDALGATGLAYRDCSRSGRKGRQLLGFDASGKTLWEYNLPVDGRRPTSVVGVLSVDPLLVRVLDGTGKKEVWRVDPRTGKHQVVVDLANRSASDPCERAGSDGLYDCSGHALSDGVLFLQQRNGIEAYDVGTGEALWRSEWDTKHKVSGPLGLDAGGQPLVYLLPTKDDPAAVVKVDRANGAMTAIATLPEAPRGSYRPGGSSLLHQPEAVDWHDGHLALYRVRPSSRDAGYAATLILK
ncbi:outer membrane protein assembly factor BamB [Kribbella amoyensis]|uniref:Outer membrane protein assembly factor BamB n=1 Tax=Kribbella amoyensis TaxID=996641 RepID=A0A561B8B7_9ACTN|nr:PQQ-binding-like beta-propeller repeat protein [Kribbella amoyensis]TWD75039.1 outer membrane protein assembly factor BamB [Kribbella amoyensis]